MKRIAILLSLAFIGNLNSFAQIRIDTAGYIKNNSLIYSLVISKNNKIIHQQYFNGQDSTTLFNDQSLTKSVMALLIGIAIDKGYIRSVDEKIADFFPKLKIDTDKRKQDITIHQVMNQASGFYHEGVNVGALLTLPDPSGYVIKAPLVSEPGKMFRYNNAATHLLSVIITKSTGMDTRAFAKKFLFDPLGITNFDWKKMKDGYYDGCGLLSIRLRSVDMLKLGNLVLNKGIYYKQQIVPAKWITAIINPEVTDMNYEILETEKAMLKNGLLPSVFFRFPGLVSDQQLVYKLTDYGLIPIGTDAWLAKGQQPQAGSIVLIHGNGNEPTGVNDFIKLLQSEAGSIAKKQWLLYDLRESVEEEFEGSN